MVLLSMLDNGRPWYILRDIYNKVLEEHKWTCSSLIAVAQSKGAHRKSARAHGHNFGSTEGLRHVKGASAANDIPGARNLISLLLKRGAQLHSRWHPVFNRIIQHLKASVPVAIIPAASMPSAPTARCRRRLPQLPQLQSPSCLHMECITPRSGASTSCCQLRGTLSRTQPPLNAEGASVRRRFLRRAAAGQKKGKAEHNRIEEWH